MQKQKQGYSPFQLMLIALLAGVILAAIGISLFDLFVYHDPNGLIALWIVTGAVWVASWGRG